MKKYKDEDVEIMVKRYKAAPTQVERDRVVVAIAEELRKTVASVRAKLVKEGVYIKKLPTTKNGGKIQTKDEMVAELEKTLNLEVGALESLEKATKRVIGILIKEVT